MKLLTWNINGLRSNLTNLNLTAFLDDCEADIICFQETKLTRSELTSELACPPNYDAFYSFSKLKKGYSGVATFVRTNSIQTLAADTTQCIYNEGRLIITEHDHFVLMNTYCPAHGGNLERKMIYHEYLSSQIANCRDKYKHKPIVLVGDLNVIHKPIDDCGDFEAYEATAWLDDVLGENDMAMVDAFRHFHPNDTKAYTCWRTLTGARETNYGVRIDYILLDKRLLSDTLDVHLWVEKQGSDHCPVVAQFTFDKSNGAPTTVLSCAKYYPEFAGIQTSMQVYLDTSAPPVQPTTILKKRTTSTWQQQSFKSFLTTASSKRSKVDNSSPPPPASTESQSIQQLSEYQTVAKSWKQLLPGKAPPPPLCSGHKEPSLQRTVLKRNDNYGRKFYICAKPEGAKGDPKARCNFFQWAN
ncbi:DNA-(apurinic or apyrimidinic site) lyase [Thraustotheca clavata]|uniref:DNA-(apurinic or apyrimidinic site) endonuclease n=1 Tax=Thraustotheca clavata TaxID=74557 RepID=A0A1V9ZMU1_9STRA|nr:DNA-(apurinic or apyrimidinic site) lyase [Thraustotheca clavata]